MKKLLCVVGSVLICLSAFAGCSKEKTTSNEKTNAVTNSASATQANSSAQINETINTDKMPTVLNTAEYTLYQNIFFNDQKKDYDGKSATKEGTFATIYDAYNDVTRYYVWGYNDNTKCCDWQWEIKFDNEENLPTNGSLVQVKGTYKTDDKALDGLWITSPKITVKQAFKTRGFDIDMLSMSNTLERVQTSNISYKTEKFNGKTVCGYGRMKSATAIEDAYYDNSWAIEVVTKDKIPAFGTVVEFSGKVDNGGIVDCKLAENTQY